MVFEQKGVRIGYLAFALVAAEVSSHFTMFRLYRYGFIIPTAENTPTEEVIFVHQTVSFATSPMLSTHTSAAQGIQMEGDYRTLVREREHPGVRRLYV